MRRWWKAMLPALAVLLPALGLAVLGLRSYQAEQVLSETRFKRSLRGITDLMGAGLEEAANSAIRELADLARAGLPTDVEVERVRKRHPLIGQVFVLGRQGQFLYPTLSPRRPAAVRSTPRFDTPRPTRPGANINERVKRFQDRLQREEAAQRLLKRAASREAARRLAAAYRDFRAVAGRSARLATRAYLGMARTALARRRWLEAAQAYAVLDQRYGTQRDWAGVSFALIGRLGLLRVATRCRERAPSGTNDMGCPTGLASPQQAAFELYTELVHDRLQTDLHRRIWYIDWIRKRIYPPATPEAQRRLAELDASVALLRIGLRFAAELGPDVTLTLVHRAGFRPRALRHSGFRKGRALLLVRSLGTVVVGFVLRRAELRRHLQRLQSRQQLPEGFSVRLRRLPVPPSAKPQPTHVRSLGEVLGDLGLAIIGPSRRNQGFLDRPAVEYLGLVGFLVLVLFAGLFTIYRGVRHETELARLKSEFVSNVSHELKTPLTSIRMFGEMLQQGLAPDQDQRDKYYTIIVAESERLGRLIANVLDFSRMERGTKTYTVEGQSLAELAREAVETFGHFREAKAFDLQLRIEADPEVSVDRDAVIQSMINLLTNAVKYSGTGRQVRVTITANRSRGIVEVADDGIGIPGRELKRVFDDFYRASNVHHGGTEGTGLGLALVRRHCENMGGRVEVESSLGGGSTFRMVFPIRST